MHVSQSDMVIAAASQAEEFVTNDPAPPHDAAALTHELGVAEEESAVQKAKPVALEVAIQAGQEAKEGP